VYSASQIALVLSARSLLLLQQSKAQKPYGLLPAVEKGAPCGRLFCARDLAVGGQAGTPARLRLLKSILEEKL